MNEKIQTVTVFELADYLGVSTSTVHRWVQKYGCPVCQPDKGMPMRFVLGDVLAWYKSNYRNRENEKHSYRDS